jgi:preprotein translocase subunit SecA
VLLENLAARQYGWAVHFSVTDVREAFSRPDATAERRGRFADPWNFYAPEAIASRQERWAEEDARHLARDASEDAPAPYVRAVPKIGRNDPCPCSSGKKYKKCCLLKQDL